MNRAVIAGLDGAPGALGVPPATTNVVSRGGNRGRVGACACADSSSAVCSAAPRKWCDGNSFAGDVGARASVTRIAARAQRRIVVFLDMAEALAFEAKGRHCFVHSTRGVFAVDLSLIEIQRSLGGVFIRVHRSWLANERCVREIDHSRGACWLAIGHSGAASPAIRVPVARELSSRTTARLLAGTIGVRRWKKGRGPWTSALTSAVSRPDMTS